MVLHAAWAMEEASSSACGITGAMRHSFISCGEIDGFPHSETPCFPGAFDWGKGFLIVSVSSQKEKARPTAGDLSPARHCQLPHRRRGIRPCASTQARSVLALAYLVHWCSGWLFLFSFLAGFAFGIPICFARRLIRMCTSVSVGEGENRNSVAWNFTPLSI